MGEVTKNIRTFVPPYEEQPYTFAMEFEYDSWNRIQKMTYPDREVVSYGYDKGGMLQWVTGEKNGAFHTYIDSISYNKFGLKELVLNSNGTESRYEYDVLLRLDSVTTYDGESNRHLLQAVKYSYDSVGNITSITNSAAMVNGIGGPYHVDYAYDSLYRITHAEGYHNTDETAYVVDMRYYANGRIQRKAVRQPDVFKNSVKWYSSQYSYPAQGNKLTGIFPSVSGGNLPTYLKLTEMHLQPHIPYTFTWENYNYSFQWDGAGNLIQQTNNVNNTVRQLSWDAENRLQGVKDNSYLSLYQYDANGERTYKLTGAGYIQNINGVPTRRYALVNATLYASPYLVATPKGYTKHYYAENERIASRIGGGGMFGIDTPIVNMDSVTDKQTANGAYMDEVIQEGLEVTYYTGDNLFDTFYYWKTVHSNFEPDCYWYHPDHLGSVSWVTDNNGEVVQYLYYLPWGEDYLNQRRNGYSGARHTFSAKEKDTETGYSYFGSRYYSSDLSIWLSVDPMSDKYPSLSPYTYCANNPIKLMDPNGEEVIFPDDPSKKNFFQRGWNAFVKFDESLEGHHDGANLGTITQEDIEVGVSITAAIVSAGAALEAETVAAAILPMLSTVNNIDDATINTSGQTAAQRATANNPSANKTVNVSKSMISGISAISSGSKTVTAVKNVAKKGAKEINKVATKVATNITDAVMSARSFFKSINTRNKNQKP